MAFVRAASMRSFRFNSQTSLNFLDRYEEFRDSKRIEEANKKPSESIAPSSFYCDRLSWFRLRGVDPDKDQHPDSALDWRAKIGTEIHRLIQSDLEELLQDDWIQPEDYLRDNPISYRYTSERFGYETRFNFTDLNIKFACDGIIRLDGKYYLLEIKTIESSTFENISDSEPRHRDQVKCYCALLNLDGVIFIYVDRTSGNLKCFELQIKQSDKDAVFKRIDNIHKAVETNIAPDRLPFGDNRCSYCKYKKRCKDWG